MTDLVRQVNLKRMPVNRKLIAWVFVVTGIISGWLWWREQKPKLELEPLKISYQIERKEVAGDRDVSRETSRLVTQIRGKLNSVQGTWAVAVYRLDEKKGYGVGEERVLPAASIMKVPIMLAAVKNLNVDDIYMLRDADKQSGSGPIEFMDSGTKLSVKDLITYMAKNSDNTAPVVLMRMVGKNEVIEEIKRLSMKDTDFEENTTTARDVVAMWKKIYEEKNELVLDVLQDSIYEDRIPLGLPDGIKLVHKVGSGDGVWSDAGVVMAEKPFVLVIMNEGVEIDEAKKLVPELTKLIWDFEVGRSAKLQ